MDRKGELTKRNSKDGTGCTKRKLRKLESAMDEPSQEELMATLRVSQRPKKEKGGTSRLGQGSRKKHSSGDTHDCGASIRTGIMVDILASSSDEEAHEERGALGSARYQPKNCFGGVLEKGECYFRSNITTAVRELDAVKFREEHYSLMAGTPFFLFVNAVKELDYEELLGISKKNEEAIRNVMAQFDSPRGCFMLGDETIVPNKRDVQLIFGVVDGGTEIPVSGVGLKVPAWLLRCFPSSACLKGNKWALTKKQLYDKLVGLVDNEDNISVEDSIRLNHCYVLACVFAPKQNAAIPWYIAVFVEKLEAIMLYDSSGYIVAILLCQMKKSTNMHSGGCAMFLLYWLCEHTTFVEPKEPDRFPRCFQWDLRELYSNPMLYQLPRLKKPLVRLGMLRATVGEKRTIKLLLVAKEGGVGGVGVKEGQLPVAQPDSGRRKRARIFRLCSVTTSQHPRTTWMKKYSIWGTRVMLTVNIDGQDLTSVPETPLSGTEWGSTK